MFVLLHVRMKDFYANSNWFPSSGQIWRQSHSFWHWETGCWQPSSTQVISH